MSTLNGTVLSLLDAAKRRDPNGKIAGIVELLSQNLSLTSDIEWKECNDGTTELTTVRTGLPDVAWRQINEGVAPSKSTTAQVREATGMLEAYNEVDCALAELSGDVAGFRLSEAMAFLEAMKQEMEQTMFYGNSGTAPKEFMGLAPRYSLSTAGNGENIIKGGGSQSDNSSIWLVCHGASTFHGIYPKGSTAGLAHKDLGEVTIESAAGMGSGNRLQAYREHFKWQAGAALRDWRYVVRICNIDISSNNADLIDLMIKAIHRLPSENLGKPVFYMNRTIFQRLDILRRDDVITGGGLTYDKVDGVMVPSFRGIVIRKSDALTEAEATVA